MSSSSTAILSFRPLAVTFSKSFTRGRNWKSFWIVLLTPLWTRKTWCFFYQTKFVRFCYCRCWLEMNRHRRRSLACYLNERLHREQQLENYDKSKWWALRPAWNGTNGFIFLSPNFRYQVNQACLPPSFSQRFTPWQMDEETQSFISNCYTKSDRFLANLFYSLLRTLLKLFLTSTSICGLLGCGRMHIFSRAQIEKFISDDDDHHRWIRDNGATLLDIGAGDGHITQKIAHFFDHVYATEASSFMVKRLKSRGYDILE